MTTEPLAALLGGFVSDWNRQRPSTAGRFGAKSKRDEVSPVSAVSWLAAETGIPEPTIENVVACRYETTELRVADPLVQALDRPQAWHDGTLEIKPNPWASAAARAACCGGSLTGSFDADGALARIAACY